MLELVVATSAVLVRLPPKQRRAVLVYTQESVGEAEYRLESVVVADYPSAVAPEARVAWEWGQQPIQVVAAVPIHQPY